jgi:hypothetical protein
MLVLYSLCTLTADDQFEGATTLFAEIDSEGVEVVVGILCALFEKVLVVFDALIGIVHENIAGRVLEWEQIA